MDRSQTRTASLLALLVCPALSACRQGEPTFAFADTLQVPVAEGQGTSLVRTNDSSSEIAHLAVSDDYLFFSINWQGLVRMPKYGGPPDWVDQDAQAEVLDVTADGAEAFWVRSTFAEPGDVPHTKLERRLASGGPVGIMKDGGIGAGIAGQIPTLAVDAANLYVLDVDATLVWVFPLQGGAPSQVSFAGLVDPASSGATFPNWVPDYPAIYFSNCPVASTCALWKADASDGSFVSLMPLQAGPGGDSVVAVDDAFVYLIKGGQIVRMSKADLTVSDVTVPGAGQSTSGPLLLDESNVYFTSYGATVQILKVPKTGGLAQPIGWGSQLQQGIWELAQDPTFVFVLVGPNATDSGNEILMFPKTPVSSPDAGQPAM
jgi:hypothetical protein